MIAESRADLLNDLSNLPLVQAEEMKLYGTYQDKIPATPCIIVVPPLENLIEPGPEFSTYRIFFDIVVLVEIKESTEASAVELEAVIESLIELDSDWLVAPTVGSPIQQERNNAIYLGSIVSVSKIVKA